VAYPDWVYYPSRTRAPAWVDALIAVVGEMEEEIGSVTVEGLTSDIVLAKLRPGLELLDYRVEAGKHKQQSRRARPRAIAYEVDAVHDSGRLQLPFQGLLLFGY
jgi:hypothetical protein